VWIKLSSNDYLCIPTGATLSVTSLSSTNWRVGTSVLGSTISTVRSGFVTEEDARAALDELMGEQGFEQIQPPVTEEEKAEEE